MKTTAGTTAAILFSLAAIVSPAFADDAAKPQTLTETEKATAVKTGSLVDCIDNARFELALEALGGKYSKEEQDKTIKEIIKKDFEAAAKTCETSAGITAAEANAFTEALIAKYGSLEETQRVINNTFDFSEP